MSVVGMTLAAEGTPAQERSAGSRRARWVRPVLGLLVPVGLAVIWEIVVRLGWSNGRLAPPPSVIFQTFVDLARTGELQRDTLVTLGRVAAGFALGAVVGTVLGAATGYSALLRRLLDPSLQGLRAIPSIAWIPLFILWLGIFEA
ncbi:MAG: ABC transporter permease, partial [Xanthobacteraceae bacterium]